MKPRYLQCAVLLACLLTPNASGSAATPSSDPAISLLKQVKAAMGGAKWDSVTAIDGDGQKTSFGLNGSFQKHTGFGTGFFAQSAQYGVFSNAEGLEKTGRWRQDNSGQVHWLDSQEAVTVAKSESYLLRFGYLFPERLPATFSLCVPGEDKGFNCLIVTPARGRALTLWIDAATRATANVIKLKAQSGLAHRHDIVTVFEYCEVDEGRKV